MRKVCLRCKSGIVRPPSYEVCSDHPYCNPPTPGVVVRTEEDGIAAAEWDRRQRRR